MGINNSHERLIDVKCQRYWRTTTTIFLTHNSYSFPSKGFQIIIGIEKCQEEHRDDALREGQLDPSLYFSMVKVRDQC